jgi:hypothetical protein
LITFVKSQKNKVMSTIEKQYILKQQIDVLPDEVLDKIALLIRKEMENKSQNQNEDFIDTEKFYQLLNKTSTQYQDVWKALA